MVSRQDTRPADFSPGQVRAEPPHPKSPSCWVITRTEQSIRARWIPSQSFACKNTHFGFHRSQSCLPGTLGGTHSAKWVFGSHVGKLPFDLWAWSYGLFSAETQTPGDRSIARPTSRKKKGYPLPNKAEAAAETGKSLRQKPTLLSSSRALQCRLLK